MKKKSFALLLILLVVSLTLSASFMKVGLNYSFDFPVNKESDNPVDISALNLSNFRLGTEVRFNIGYLTLEESIRGSFTDQLALSSFDILSSASLKTKFFFLDILLGAGIMTKGEKVGTEWLYNGILSPSFGDMLKTSTLFYKAGLDFNIGKRITLAFSALLPLSQSWNTLSSVQDISVIDALKPELDKTEVTVSFLLNFF